jgi:hypothetical protein
VIRFISSRIKQTVSNQNFTQKTKPPKPLFLPQFELKIMLIHKETPKMKQSAVQQGPIATVPERGIGPIDQPNVNDVVSGRGRRINAHVGNVQFRGLVNTHKPDYLKKSTKKLEKAHIAAEIVYTIRRMDPPGRFLQEEADGSGVWWDIGDARAFKKVGQALREHAPDIRGRDMEECNENTGVAAKITSATIKNSSKPSAPSSLTESTPTVASSSPVVLLKANARKRQHCQTTGALVENTTANSAVNVNASRKRPSKAQPGPVVVISERGIGPVRTPNVNDVLSGRGGRVNAHAGNMQFRELVARRKKGYLSTATKKLDKAHIAADIVYSIRRMTPPGRFLKEEADGSGVWWDIGDTRAFKKVGQALREDAPDIREPEMESVGQDKNVPAKSTSGPIPNDSKPLVPCTSRIEPTPTTPAGHTISSTTSIGSSMPLPPTTTSAPSRVECGCDGKWMYSNNSSRALVIMVCCCNKHCDHADRPKKRTKLLSHHPN